jgi:hypothetical protein
MPSASANISAKFIAQIEISKPCVSSASSPAEESSPRMVSISGRPAATSEPNASTRIPSVTGQERSSDVIIAERFAVLKSLHIPDAPVSETATPPAPAAASFGFSASAAATIAVGSPAAPPRTSAVCPSAETVAPAVGGTIRETRRSERRIRSTRVTVARNAGSEWTRDGECTTTVSAELERPPKSRWISARARTDSDPLACQPAPDRAVSTLGAKTPSATATTAHASATSRP